MIANQAGAVVAHKDCREWGYGKVICNNGGYLLVVFPDAPGGRRALKMQAATDRLEPAPPGDYPPLAALQVRFDLATCEEIVGRKAGSRATRRGGPAVPRLTNEQAYERFLGAYPDGFEGQHFRRAERDWKWVKHEKWCTSLPGDALRRLAAADPDAAGRCIMQVVQTGPAPLLHPKGELPVLRTGLLSGAPAQAYFEALAAFLDREPEDPTFTRLADALSSLPTKSPNTHAGKWVMLTVVPFLAQPDRHMFLKPTYTTRAADWLGEQLLYSPVLKWDTYARLLDWSGRLFEFLKPLGARDMIDVQSFLWVLVEGALKSTSQQTET